MDANPRQFGRYTLCRMIARGGMGEIYLAQLQGVAGFEKTCVIKKIRADLACDETFRERFLNEGRTLVALTHSNIVQIFDMGEVEDEYYLAMEYVDGADLRALMRCSKAGKMPVETAIAVAECVLRGMSYAHRAVDVSGQPLGIVHRDISPSNILISVEGDVKIIDFGIAKVKTVESCSGVVQGKFAYMSPEQARGEKLDARTDIFSLGIVLYEMLTGVRPFEGDSDLQSLERIKCSEPRKVNELRRDVDEELSKIVEKSLQKDREERYQSADEFYDALNAYAKSAGLDDSQRAISLYFRPLMEIGAAPVSMNDALDAMLDAQALGMQTTATMTMQPRSSSQNQMYVRRSSSGENARISRPVASSDEQFNRVQALEDVEISNDAVPVRVESSEIEPDKNDRNHKISHGFVYVLAAVVIAFLVVGVIFLLQGTRETFEQPKTQTVLLHEETPENQDELEADEFVWNMAHSVSEMPGAFWHGIPVFVNTVPENATIYVVEGAYRKLEEKSVTLLSDSDVELAIQAPGYETCMISVQFNLQAEQTEHLIWQNCRNVVPVFSVFKQRVELNVNLNSIQAMKKVLQQEEEVVAPLENAEPDKEKNQIDNKADKEKASVKMQIKTAEKTQKKPDILSVQFKSSVPGLVIVGGKHYDTPAQVDVLSGTSYQIMPQISGRKVAVPYKGVISGSQVNAAFCEAKIRIKESFAPNDPAPYQLSDIYLDGARIATRTDSVTVVLPCKPYELEARIQAGDVQLAEKQKISVVSDGQNVFSLKLKAVP